MKTTQEELAEEIIEELKRDPTVIEKERMSFHHFFPEV